MYAVISDLHSNLAALEAVFADVASCGVDEVLCLGDVVGYGPDPVACLRLVREKVKLTLLGNHDEALMSEPFNFSAAAKAAIDWTRAQLPRDDPDMDELWAFLADLELMHQRGPDLFVHGSPTDPTQDYLMPGDDLTSPKYDDVFEEFERLLFVGHTHLPCVITPDRKVRRAGALGNEYKLDADQAIVNVGSVGQPRDRDPRSCWVLVDDDRITWRRVPYDVQQTMDRIRAAGLPAQLAERLMSGK